MNKSTGVRVNDVEVVFNGRRGYMFTNLKEMVMKYDKHFSGLRRPLPDQCFFHPIQGDPFMVQISQCVRVTQNDHQNMNSKINNNNNNNNININTNINSNMKSTMNSGSRLKTPRDHNSTSTIAPQLSLGQQQKSKIGSKLTTSTNADIVAFGRNKLLSKDGDHPHSPPTQMQSSSNKSKSNTNTNYDINRDNELKKRDLDEMKTPGATASSSSSSSNKKKHKEKGKKKNIFIQASKSTISQPESEVELHSSPRRSKRTKTTSTPPQVIVNSSTTVDTPLATAPSSTTHTRSNVNTDSNLLVPVLSSKSKAKQLDTSDTIDISDTRCGPAPSRSKPSPIKAAAAVKKNSVVKAAAAVRVSARNKSSTSNTSVDEVKEVEKVEKVSSTRTTRAASSSSFYSSSSSSSVPVSVTKASSYLPKSQSNRKSQPKSIPKSSFSLKKEQVKKEEVKVEQGKKEEAKNTEAKKEEERVNEDELKKNINEKEKEEETEIEEDEEEEEETKVNVAAVESERWRKWQRQQDLQKQKLLYNPAPIQSATGIGTGTGISQNETQNYTKSEQVHKTVEFATIREGIAEARVRMQNAYAPGVVSGREIEYRQMHSFLEEGLVEGCGRSMYVCGASGIGKTMTMTTVLNNLLKQRDELYSKAHPNNKNIKKNGNDKDKDDESSGLEINPDLPDFDYIRLQGTALDDPLGTLAEKLDLDTSCGHETGGRRSRDNKDEKERTRLALRQRLCLSTRSRSRKSNTASAFGKMVLLFIDEVDRSSSAGIRELFLLSSDPNSLLVLVGLANSIDFPNQLGLPVESEPKVVVFSTYSADDLALILQVRGIGLFESRACTFLARKFTDTSDVRRLLSAANRCMTQAESNLSADELAGPMRPIVMMKDVAVVVNSTGLSSIRVPKIIDDLPTGVYPLLTACILSNPDGQSMTLPEIEGYHSYYAREISIPTMSRDEIRRYLNILLDFNLVSVKKSNRRVHPDKACQYRLTMKKDDLLKAKNLPKLHQEKLRSNKF